MKNYFINYALFLTLIIVFVCCNNEKNSIDKYQKVRKNITNVKDKVKDLKTDIIIGRSWLYVFHDYLIVCDTQNPDKGIHFFDNKTFEYINTTGKRGKGPGEIVRYGHFGFDYKNRFFYVADPGKEVMFRFMLDSALTFKNYLPKKVFSLNKELFPTTFDFINDSVLIGTGIGVINYNTYNQSIVKNNIKNNDIVKIGNHHPDINPKNLTVFFSMSANKAIYVQAHEKYDLLSISNLEGETLYNIFGPQWEKEKTENDYYYVTKIMGDKIIAAFIGGKGVIIDNFKRPKAAPSTKFLVFNVEDGSYIKTLETEHEMFYFCVDENNNRIIAYFNDRINPLGYIDLDGILD